MIAIQAAIFPTEKDCIGRVKIPEENPAMKLEDAAFWVRCFDCCLGRCRSLSGKAFPGAPAFGSRKTGLCHHRRSHGRSLSCIRDAGIEDGNLNFTNLPGVPIEISGHVYEGLDGAKPLAGAAVEICRPAAMAAIIAFDRSGDGPALILIGGALSDRSGVGATGQASGATLHRVQLRSPGQRRQRRHAAICRRARDRRYRGPHR